MTNYQNVIIDGIGSMKITTESGEPLKLDQKIMHDGIKYHVYRMRTEEFKAYFYLRKLQSKP